MVSAPLPENPLIDELRRLCGSRKIFLVGGSVRDVLAKQEMKDYDFLVEGEVFNFAFLLAKALNCKFSLNRRLLTATLETTFGTIDLSSARKERYALPGSLPTVIPATWQEDLLRRDFTINTLVIPLLSEGWGKILDLTGGLRDIEHKLIRVLHENSFRDDPTRLLRALRLKNRLGYALEGKTKGWLRRDWPYLACLSPARRFKEWRLISSERKTAQILADLWEQGGWTEYLPTIPYRSENITALSQWGGSKRVDDLRPWYLYLLILLYLSEQDADYFAREWGLTRNDCKGLRKTLDFLRQKNIRAMKRRRIYSKIRGMPLEGIYLIYGRLSADEDSWGKFAEFYERVRLYQMPLTGDDLLSLGLEPGPRVGDILRRLESNYEEEMFATKEEGLSLAKKYIQEIY